ncbi:hypothetical protein KDK95_03815 [Actinospica sp. MGRD01-02]|uniref:Uncharacterized protein n=1 Tax=Actinospica acidithermotolerans TaxID=2828514 RepID=A0A941IFU4_9ACTN|nr:putative leader peptide [Actinospica acidithermotolerans]MBR7825419.1 hypothetical protein [Actinospica acidithermotolerans]
MRSPDVMTAPEGQHPSVPPFAGTTARSADPSVLLVARRHVDLGRLASALCR